MVNFLNLKTNTWTKFYLNETEPVIDDLLNSSFKDLNAIFSYIKTNKEHYIYKKLDNKYSESQKILMILMNSSINGYGEEAYEALIFDNNDINNLIENMFMGYDKIDLFDSITKICYVLINEEMKNKKTIFSWIKKILS